MFEGFKEIMKDYTTWLWLVRYEGENQVEILEIKTIWSFEKFGLNTIEIAKEKISELDE